MKFHRILLMSMIAMGLFGLALNPALAADPVALGKFSLVEGNVNVRHPEAESDASAKIGTELFPGDVINVPAEGRAEVVYTEGHILRVAPGSKAEIGLQSVKLFDGKTWVRVIKNGGHFEVVAPTFVAGVRGTRFAVEAVKGAKPALKVFDGAVEAKSAKNAKMVGVGQAIEVTDEVVSEPAAFDALRDAQWSELPWQATEAKQAYDRYLIVLFKGLTPQDLASSGIAPELRARQKLPEVEAAYQTYQALRDSR